MQNGRLYCLSARPETGGGFAITVTRFDRDWKRGVPVLTFTAPTFARSFAVYRGRFYFGLWTETGITPTLSDAAGTVLSTLFTP